MFYLQILLFLKNEEYLDDTDFEIHQRIQIRKFDVSYSIDRTETVILIQPAKWNVPS